MKGKRRWQGQAEKEVSCGAASTEVSANTIGNSEVGSAFRSYPKLGLGGQAFIRPASPLPPEFSHQMRAASERQ